jgi:hypothetical protein
MGRQRVLAALAVAIAVAGCGSDHKTVTPSLPAPTITSPRSDVGPDKLTARQQADDSCRKVEPKNFVNALPTTVGAIHAIVGGPPAADGTQPHPYASLLKDAPPQEFAVWCWYQPEPQSYKLLVIGASGEVVDTGQRSSGGPPKPGPLQPL